jgi:hypothetical protein
LGQDSRLCLGGDSFLSSSVFKYCCLSFWVNACGGLLDTLVLSSRPLCTNDQSTTHQNPPWTLKITNTKRNSWIDSS